MNESLLILFFLIATATNAQGTVESKSPFSEPRYHYFLKTILLFNEYLDTDNGSFNTTQVRALVPIGDKAWNLRFDLPLISANTNSINKSGIGDVGMGVSYIPFMERQNGIALRARVYANSAADPNFGSGKWVVMPAVFYGKYMSGKKFLWIASLEYQASFAGSSERSDISVIAYENVLFHFFGKNWIAADVAFRYNSILEGFQNNAFLEFGRKITPTNLAYIHPSVAFGGNKTYNYGLEVGLLILF
ncbi:lipid A phosphoethanolamine transferase [Flavobacterium sp. Fl-318]|uniref:Lipid A phosphoethanolamine transferase n=1 Tax=Flavobacterium cupriresistens TaxID=2893885 RepID=A0ABU4RB09_9FLAO|nr:MULTISPECIES: lipid A phosphoethanolamine transferase [unclassified Flavobacterium]MDX6189773.1 lipid A phosphoethanolamine transferase [Flavobacterium sp. Fl-318]UFH40820.1 lipid A phosphoethanolamine transferase [Flavobacterium sp. F-323]